MHSVVSMQVIICNLVSDSPFALYLFLDFTQVTVSMRPIVHVAQHTYCVNINYLQKMILVIQKQIMQEIGCMMNSLGVAECRAGACSFKLEL